jgi:hypothetical protein
MTPRPPNRTLRVDEWEIRRIFNEDRIAERGESGELRVEIKRSKPATNPALNNWMPGTLSQELRYYDQDNNLIAKAHRYLRPDGRFAASGLIDPKRVRHGDTMYILQLPDLDA